MITSLTFLPASRREHTTSAQQAQGHRDASIVTGERSCPDTQNGKAVQVEVRSDDKASSIIAGRTREGSLAESLSSRLSHVRSYASMIGGQSKRSVQKKQKFP